MPDPELRKMLDDYAVEYYAQIASSNLWTNLFFQIVVPVLIILFSMMGGMMGGGGMAMKQALRVQVLAPVPAAEAHLHRNQHVFVRNVKKTSHKTQSSVKNVERNKTQSAKRFVQSAVQN
jgi:ABC-type Na+ efflux pump permease subunit